MPPLVGVLGMVIASILLPATTSLAQEPEKWLESEGGNGHWYARIPAEGNYDLMRSRALSAGANLASINSAEENAFLADFAGGVQGAAVYFGARSVPGCPDNFEWSDGTPWEYTNWGPGQPMCYLGAPVGFQGDQWHDIFNYGTNAVAAIFEWSADCNGDGIVDYGQLVDGTFPDENGNGVPDCCDANTCIPPFQWRVEDGGNGHWYEAFGCCTPFEDARAEAEAMGGHLVTYTSAAEEAFVEDRVGSSWLGLRRDSDNTPYYWITGEPLDYTNWHKGKPDTPGSHLAVSDFGNSDGWADAPNEGQSGVIVEWSADCNGDGIVDYGQILDGTFPDANENGVPDCCDEVNCDSVQWRVEFGGNGHWYRLELSAGITWEEAMIIAEARGGYLATPTTNEENNYLYGMIDSSELWIIDSFNNASGPYLGAAQEDDTPNPDEGWYWVSGEPWEFTAWAFGQPNNANENQNRLHFWSDTPARTATWNDIPAVQTSNLPGTYIIEFSADCNDDGIVDYGQILDGTFADQNENGIPDCCDVGVACGQCAGDITGNGAVDAADLGILLALWGTDGKSNPSADINQDGLINGGDIGLLLNFWGPCP
ncbi:MAG: lectin-like protein [Myxococcota bacterium]